MPNNEMTDRVGVQVSEPDSAKFSPLAGFIQRVVACAGEGALLLLLTSFSYMTAYLFKVGAYDAYGLPAKLVKVDITDCLSAGAALTTAAWTIFWLINAGVTFWHGISTANKWLRATLACGVIFWMVYSIFSSLFGTSVLTLFKIVGITLVVLLVGVAVALGLRGLGNKLGITNDASAVAAEDHSPAAKINRIIGDDFYILFLVFLMVVTLVKPVSMFMARKGSLHDRVANTQYIVVDYIEDDLLCKALNKEEIGFEEGFFMISREEIKPLKLKPIMIKSSFFESSKKDEVTNDLAVPVSTSVKPKSESVDAKKSAEQVPQLPPSTETPKPVNP